jgi:hypothetical protein
MCHVDSPVCPSLTPSLFIVQGGSFLQGASRKKREREREREREITCPAGRVHQFCQLGPPTPSVGVLVRPSPMSCVTEWPSCSIPIRHALSVGCECAPISTVWQSRLILGATPYHSIVMETCLPYRDDVAPRPFARTAGGIVSHCCDNKGDCNPRGGSGSPRTAS